MRNGPNLKFALIVMVGMMSSAAWAQRPPSAQQVNATADYLATPAGNDYYAQAINLIDAKSWDALSTLHANATREQTGVLMDALRARTQVSDRIEFAFVQLRGSRSPSEMIRTFADLGFYNSRNRVREVADQILNRLDGLPAQNRKTLLTALLAGALNEGDHDLAVRIRRIDRELPLASLLMSRDDRCVPSRAYALRLLDFKLDAAEPTSGRTYAEMSRDAEVHHSTEIVRHTQDLRNHRSQGERLLQGRTDSIARAFHRNDAYQERKRGQSPAQRHQEIERTLTEELRVREDEKRLCRLTSRILQTPVDALRTEREFQDIFGRRPIMSPNAGPRWSSDPIDRAVVDANRWFLADQYVHGAPIDRNQVRPLQGPQGSADRQ